MKITKLAALMIIPFTLIGCKNKNEEKTRENDTPPSDFDPSILVENVEEKDFKKIPGYISSKMTSYSSYKSVTTGETVSTLIIKITQTINATAIKGEYSYLKNQSTGYLNTVHEAYYHSSKALYRDSSDADFSLSSMDEYLNNYGTDPFGASIEGYSVNEDCIKSVEKISSENSEYVFKVVFDNEKSTNNVKIRMKKEGGLNDYPTFSLIEMKLVVNNDFTLKSIDLHSKYVAKKGFNANCEQTYKVEFSNYNENNDVPNLESVKDLFN